MKTYMCLGVRFDGSNKVYNYLSDDFTIEKGDYVVVSGKIDKVVQVVDVGFYTEEELLYPLGKLKKIKSLYKENNDRFIEGLLDEDSYEDAFFDGTYFLVSAGCTYSYHLIMNGPHRGEVWLADNGNYFVPISKSFSEFLKYLLTAEII